MFEELLDVIKKSGYDGFIETNFVKDILEKEKKGNNTWINGLAVSITGPFNYDYYIYAEGYVNIKVFKRGINGYEKILDMKDDLDAQQIMLKLKETFSQRDLEALLNDQHPMYYCLFLREDWWGIYCCNGNKKFKKLHEYRGSLINAVKRLIKTIKSVEFLCTVASS